MSDAFTVGRIMAPIATRPYAFSSAGGPWLQIGLSNGRDGVCDPRRLTEINMRGPAERRS
ncbi:hypothetical protein MyNCGM152_25730 [Achromobacter xylosoxidans]